MDPSEFEGTVERHEDALGAGALELLLVKNEPVFTQLDLSKEINDICLSIFSLKDTVTKFDDISLNSLCEIMDDQALKMAELKENYILRRKQLTTKIKLFTSSHIDVQSANPDSSHMIVSDAKELIDSFKSEFDNLAALYRFSESAFLSIHKSIRTVPEPSGALTDSLAVCQQAHEALKRAQEQLQLAKNTLQEAQTKDSIGGSSSHVNLQQQHEFENYRLKTEREIEDLKQTHLNDLINIKERHEIDMRNKEHQIKNTYEKQHFDSQTLFEQSLAKKEVELEGVLRTLQELKHTSIEANEKTKILDIETQKRREIEDKLRISVQNLSQMELTYNECKLQHEKSSRELVLLQEQLHSLQKETKKLNREHDVHVGDLERKLFKTETELNKRPPVDLTHIAERIGLTIDAHNNTIAWAVIETHILDTLRKLQTEATISRNNELESSTQLTALQQELSTLKTQLATQIELTQSLEADLCSAHLNWENNKTLASFSGKHKKHNSYDNTSNSTANKEHQQLADLLLSDSGSSGGNSGNNNTNALDNGSGIGGIFRSDAERSTITATANLLSEESHSGADKIMSAIQGQRDRFMAKCHEQSVEISSLKTQLDRQNDDIDKYKKENLELYKRLRVLRVTSAANNNKSGSGNNSGKSVYRKRRNKDYTNAPHDEEEGAYGSQHDYNDNTDNADLMDNSDTFSGGLDDKYQSLYEQEINPFKIEENDKLSVLNKLNVFERGLVYLNRNIIQDRWSRHALIVYLIIVHMFALFYTFSVLNPQLAEEVDMHLKAKWSAETFNMQEHPDIDTA